MVIVEYIKRTIEDVVVHSSKTFKCVLVTGARQTGKSTLIRHLCSNIKEVSFNDPFIEDQAKNNPEMFMSLNEPPVFFDEIQYVPSLFRYIKQYNIKIYKLIKKYKRLGLSKNICSVKQKDVLFCIYGYYK